MHFHSHKIALCIAVASLCLISCIRKPAAKMPEMRVALYSGVRNFVNMNDSETVLQKRLKDYAAEKVEVKGDNLATLAHLKISHVTRYPELGITAYFKKNRVALIELQEPFKGEIQGKQIKIFEIENAPEGKTWKKVLQRKFGSPNARGSGGTFGSEALFYTWGDISYNKNGINQVSIYRDRDISIYRQKNFGRKMELFK